MSTDVDESWGPAVEPRSRRRRWPRFLGAALLALLLAAVLFGLWLSQQIGRVEVSDLATAGGPMHVLVTGSDSRAGLTDAEQAELGTGDAEGERTDTIFVMSIQGGEVALLSFPRDLWVTRCDGSTGRINVAMAIGGPGCLVRTVREVSGIPVTQYVEITFGGFQDLVEAVGGVEVCLSEPISDRDAHIDLPAGCQRLDGADALGYVRVRKIDDDLMRIQRQQTFIQALAREMVSVGTLTDPVRLTRLARDSSQAIRVDQDLGPVDMARLAIGARGLGRGRTLSATVPTDPRTTSGGAEVLDVREGEAETLFASFRDGSVFDRIPEAQQREEERLRPEDVRVTVLNGAGIAGLAATVGDALEDRGFTVLGVGNAERRETTVVRHAAGLAEAAELVADHLPGTATLEEAADVEDVTVVLGPDAGGTR